MQKAFRIGVLLSPLKGVQEYQRRALQQLRREPGVELSFAFHLSLSESEAGSGPARPNPSRLRRFLGSLIPSGCPLERRGPWGEGLPGVHLLPLKARVSGRYSYVLEAESLVLLRKLELDALLTLTTHILKGGILTATRYGVWSYHHGDPSAFRGRPPGFWEIYTGSPTSAAVLQRLNERLDDGMVLRKAVLPTVAHSFVLQKQQLYQVSIPWPAQVARQILDGVPISERRESSPSEAPIRTAPTTWQLLLFALILLKNRAKLWAHTLVNSL